MAAIEPARHSTAAPRSAIRAGGSSRELLTIVVLALCGCSSSPSAAGGGGGREAGAAASASAAPAWEAPTREGCARTGELDAIESDPSCVVTRADDSVTRESMKDVALTLAPDRPAIVAGATMLLRLTLVNRGKTDADLVLVAQPWSATSKPDWTRLAGVPELRPGASDGYRLLMPVRTMDGHDRGVDGLPTTPQTTSSAARLLRVRLKPGGKLTHAFPWWALRIPPPMPIYYDDAGHRFVPKTAPVPLPPGEYNVAVDLPLLGVSPAESAATARVVVEKVEKTDGAAALPPMVDPPF
ncbi:MAG: hypothetical protein JWP97_5811 [Labilithrix sp.]|nr:hypothetical protein [Labilithrix sp.]